MKNKGAFGKKRDKRIPIYKQHGYGSQAELDWYRWGSMCNYYAQNGHPRRKRALEAIEWSRSQHYSGWHHNG